MTNNPSDSDYQLNDSYYHIMDQANADGRTARRVEAMRRVQAVALDLFERHGFEGVTVEGIAQAAQVGPATVYRNFGTKERIVLWDEYDSMLFAALQQHLQKSLSIASIRDAFRESVGRIYKTDRQRILRRSRIVCATPALNLAALAELHVMRKELALVLRHAGVKDALAADVVAFSVVATLEAAINQWVRLAGNRSLSTLLDRAFGTLADQKQLIRSSRLAAISADRKLRKRR